MQLTFQRSWDYTDGTRLPIADEDLPTLLMYMHIERQQLLDDNILIINPGSNDVTNSSTNAAVLVGASSHSKQSGLVLPTLDGLKHPSSVIQ